MYNTILYYTILYYTILYYTMLYNKGRPADQVAALALLAAAGAAEVGRHLGCYHDSLL